jgi:hypothetical protein
MFWRDIRTKESLLGVSSNDECRLLRTEKTSKKNLAADLRRKARIRRNRAANKRETARMKQKVTGHWRTLASIPG